MTEVAESRTDDLNRRRRNYAIAMSIRTGSFLALFFVPGVWKLVPLAAAAVLPVIAVMLANAIDHRPPAPFLEESQTHLALPAGEVIRGEVVDESESVQTLPGPPEEDADGGRGPSG